MLIAIIVNMIYFQKKRVVFSTARTAISTISSKGRIFYPLEAVPTSYLLFGAMITLLHSIRARLTSSSTTSGDYLTARTTKPIFFGFY
jgi:hypothetical protein